MSDHPILFSGPMVRALLDGRKTQTRRVLALRGHKTFSEFGTSDTEGYDWHFRDACMRWHDLRDAELKAKMRITVGDRLYVRETWAPPDALKHNDPGSQASADQGFYRADGSTVDGEISRWRPGIHMPRRASRLTLLVTDVRVQRLQDISQDDAKAEGPGFIGKITGEVCESATSHRLGIGPRWRTPRDWYADLWDNLNAHRGFGWEANPWVVAISFTVHQVNIDKLEASK